MPSVSTIRISKRLPAIIVALCLASSATIAVVSYFDFKRSILAEAQKAFEILTTERSTALTTWLASVERDVGVLGSDPSVVGAITAMNASYDVMMGDGPTQTLQAAYIFDNPNPVGQKDRLDQAPEAIPYHFQHGRFHPHFRQLKQTNGYYDIFLFNMDGDLIYSVYKEEDFATNFETGTYAGSGLGQAFRASKNAAAGSVSFIDFDLYAPSNNEPASFLSTPVFDQNNSQIGVFAVQIPSSQISNILTKPAGLGRTGEIYLVGQDGLYRTNSRFEDRHSVLNEAPALLSIETALNGVDQFFPDVEGITGVPSVAKSVSLTVFSHQWAIIGEMQSSEVMEPVIAVRNKMILLSAIVAAMATLLGWRTARSVTVPLARLGAGMKSVSDKQYDVDLSDSDRADEIGDISKALVKFRDKLKMSDASEEERKTLQKEQVRIVERLSVALTKMAEGDFTSEIQTPFDGDYDKLRKDYNKIIQNLNEAIGEVANGADDVLKRSDRMSASSDELSGRTENQAATLEETAAALDKMTQSVQSAASGAKKVEGIVANAQVDADASAPIVNNAVESMNEIKKSSDEISQIIGVIDDIAFQTNLLALNAGVEAARAGDAGKGFAVVASEVRALAQRSSDAAKQIKGLIGESSVQVERGVGLVGQAGEALTKIVSHITHISTLMTDIAEGAQEQSGGLNEINLGVNQLDKVTQQNAAMVEEATSNNHALHQDAEQMARLVAKFKLKSKATRRRPTETLKAKPNNVISQKVPQPKPDLAASPAPLKATGTGGSLMDANWEDF